MTHPTVTQADREAGASLWERMRPNDNVLPEFMRAGKADSSKTIQDFARHRTATEASTAARIAALEGALRGTRDHCPQCNGTGTYRFRRNEVPCEFCEHARAALTATEGEGA